MFSDILKKVTQQNHLHLEQKIIPKIKSIRSEQDYINLLNLFYSYFGGLEPLVQTALDTRLMPDYASRRKAEAIFNDIVTLGGKPAALAETDDLPVINDHAAALGALYVLEGSTLGGQIISTMITKALPGKVDYALSFYSGYGEKTMPMWDTFKSSLNEQATSLAYQEKVIEAANETFIKFSRWIDKVN